MASEYRTVVKHTTDLRLAVRFDLVALSGELLAVGLISPDNDSELRNTRQSEAERAAKLVEIIQTKIKLNCKHYYTFLNVLRTRHQQQYSDILHKLDKTLSASKQAQSQAKPPSHEEKLQDVKQKSKTTQVKQTMEKKPASTVQAGIIQAYRHR